jgi:hypothetical protein
MSTLFAGSTLGNRHSAHGFLLAGSVYSPLTDTLNSAKMARGLLILLVAAASGPAAAQSVVCAGKIISQGVTKAQVAAACGTPMQVGKDAHEPAMGKVTVPDSDEGTEVWIYNFGPNKLMQRIWFEDGVVKLVESLGYGH